MHENHLHRIKEKAIDEEIASLKAGVQCIRDNNLESDDLLNNIDDRIIELKRQNGR